MWACTYGNMRECAYLCPFTRGRMKYPDFEGEESFGKEFASWLLLVPVLAPSTPHRLVLPEWAWPRSPGLCTPVLPQLIHIDQLLPKSLVLLSSLHQFGVKPTW